MIDDFFSQASGAIAGGVVGGFSGFVANGVLDRMTMRRARKNVACALRGEIEALCSYVELHYLAKLRPNVESMATDAIRYPYQGFRAERDYAPVFRSLGGNMGFLPSPLPRDLVYWYTGLAVCLERARELHELSLGLIPEAVTRAIEVGRIQHAAFQDLIQEARPLLKRLAVL